MKKTYPKIRLPSCPACKINNAVIDPVLGVIHCLNCQAKDVKITKPPEFYSIDKMSRVQAQRDKHSADLIQPFVGNKPNPDFAHVYKDKAKDYYSKEELEKL